MFDLPPLWSDRRYSLLVELMRLVVDVRVQVMETRWEHVTPDNRVRLLRLTFDQIESLRSMGRDEQRRFRLVARHRFN